MIYTLENERLEPEKSPVCKGPQSFMTLGSMLIFTGDMEDLFGGVE